MPRVVREHEVLRVAGWMPDDNPTASANMRSGKFSNGHKSAVAASSRPMPGRTSPSTTSPAGGIAAAYISSPALPICGLSAPTTRTRPSPNGSGPPRWSSVCCPTSPRSSAPGCWSVCPKPTCKSGRTPPGFVQQVAETCDLMSRSQRLSAELMIFETEADAEGLIHHLLDPERQLPTFVLTLEKDREGKHPWIDTVALSRAMLGIGQCRTCPFRIDMANDQGTWETQIGLRRSGTRLFAGLHGRRRSYGHRLVLANQFETVKDPARITQWMRQLADWKASGARSWGEMSSSSPRSEMPALSCDKRR